MKKLYLLVCMPFALGPFGCTPGSGQSSNTGSVAAPAPDSGPAETARVRADVTLKLTGL